MEFPRYPIKIKNAKFKEIDMLSFSKKLNPFLGIMKKNKGYVGRNTIVNAVAHNNIKSMKKLENEEKIPTTFNAMIVRKKTATTKTIRCLLKYKLYRR